MNLMTLQRYKNEIILLLSFLFMVGAFFYKGSANGYVEKNRLEVATQIAEISTIQKYKKQWDGKGLGSKVKLLKTVVPESKVKRFLKKSKKLDASYENLEAKEVTKLTNKLLNIPLQITKLDIIESSKNKFKVELKCKW